MHGCDGGSGGMVMMVVVVVMVAIEYSGLSPVIIFDGSRMTCSELASSPGA